MFKFLSKVNWTTIRKTCSFKYASSQQTGLPKIAWQFMWIPLQLLQPRLSLACWEAFLWPSVRPSSPVASLLCYIAGCCGDGFEIEKEDRGPSQPRQAFKEASMVIRKYIFKHFFQKNTTAFFSRRLQDNLLLPYVATMLPLPPNYLLQEMRRGKEREREEGWKCQKAGGERRRGGGGDIQQRPHSQDRKKVWAPSS